MRSILRNLYRGYQSACERWRLRKQALVAKQKLESFNPPYRLHIGCGAVRLDGWTNIDSNPPRNGTADIIWDVRWGIPVGDYSCELVYSEHLLEHLSVEEGVALLRECRRILEPAGTLRIAMPSLDVLIEKSYTGSWKEQDWLKWPQYQFIQTRAEMMNIAFRWWGHRWLYDHEELYRRLREAGFEEIKDARWGDSEIPELQNLETRLDSLLICEAKKQ